ncbi:ComF family protein [Asticcacaulis solisilvae]|uniref:ComF family protein n=1 Tax=Asticcacaulis solisilvae TaxID=1217274 RepID=UPI003FD854EB
MPKLTSRLGHLASEVKAFVAARATLAPVRALAGHAVDLAFPPADDGHHPSGMAPANWSKVRFLADEGCDMCARPFAGGLHFGRDALCSACAEKPFPFVKTRAACLYDDASRGIILGFKHGDRLDYAPMLVRWLERAGADLWSDVDAVLPVPLHASRLRKRRYNQAAELARPLAKHLALDYLPDALVRTRATKAQANSPDARWENVRTAFALNRGAKVAGKRIVLVDDVFTTGATLRACTRVLLEAGAAQVSVAVLARVASGNLEL